MSENRGETKGNMGIQNLAGALHLSLNGRVKTKQPTNKTVNESLYAIQAQWYLKFQNLGAETKSIAGTLIPCRTI